jgi:hypothetical protein
MKALCTLIYLLRSAVESECRASGKAFEHDHADRPHIEGRLNCELGHAAVSADGLWRGIALGATDPHNITCTYSDSSN